MSARISFTPIKAKELDAKAFIEETTKALDAETKTFEGRFRSFSDTFEETDVKYDRRVEVNDKIAEGETKTDHKIMAFLNFGTSVRHAILSKDWVSKTTPRSLGVRMGQGRVRAVSKQFRGRGIEARRWDRTLAKERVVPFRNRMRGAMKNASNDAF